MKTLMFLLAAPLFAQWSATYTSDGGAATISYNGVDYTSSASVPHASVSIGTGTDCSSPTTFVAFGGTGTQTHTSTYWEWTISTATIRITFGSLDSATLSSTTLVTNTSGTDSICSWTATALLWTPPAPGRFDENSPVNWDKGFATAFSQGSLQFGMWSPSITTKGLQMVGSNSADQQVSATSSYSIGPAPIYSFPNVHTTTIAHNASVSAVAYFRVGAASTPIAQLMPEAAQLQIANQPTSNIPASWPNRGPICRWFTSRQDYRTITDNPRGYFDFGLNATGDPSAFTTRINALVAAVLSQCSEMKCTGVIIWDVEGVEFNGWTYMGDPSLIPSIAPEMSAQIDTAVATFKAAGLRVGFTLRPSKVLAHSGPLATCQTSPSQAYQDTQIDLSKIADYTDEASNLNCTSTNTWSVDGQAQITQTIQRSLSAVQSLLQAKIDYAVSRWGADMFYVDSTQYDQDGPIDTDLWTALVAANPTVAFFPEYALSSAWALSGVYVAAGAALSSVVAIDPTRVALAGNPDSTSGYGVARGDLMGMNCWYGGNSALYNAYLATAKALNAQLVFTDTGQNNKAIQVNSAPGSAFDYPLVQRVYFSSSSGGLAASTSYCEMRGVVTCYLSGLTTGSGAIDLTGIRGWYQVRYYTFSGLSKSNGPASTLPN